jgi:hypothetical protein
MAIFNFYEGEFYNADGPGIQDIIRFRYSDGDNTIGFYQYEFSGSFSSIANPSYLFDSLPNGVINSISFENKFAIT